MSDAIDRFRARKEGRLSDTVDELNGAISDDLAKYLPLAAGAATEVAVSEQKKKEDAAAAKAAANSESGKAQAAAQQARKNASMAAADAITETDPNGPKHKLAATLNLEAQAAEAKAGFFAPALPGGMSPMSMSAFGPQGGGKSNTLTYALVGGGVLVAGLITVLLVRRKR